MHAARDKMQTGGGWLASTSRHGQAGSLMPARRYRLVDAGSLVQARRSSQHRRAGLLACWLGGWVAGCMAEWLAPTSLHQQANLSMRMPACRRARVLARQRAGSCPASTSGLARVCIAKTMQVWSELCGEASSCSLINCRAWRATLKPRYVSPIDMSIRVSPCVLDMCVRHVWQACVS